jgi:hypothetical protein
LAVVPPAVQRESAAGRCFALKKREWRSMGSEPWYKTTVRWGQTNLVEIDPERYDESFWREHWRRTRIQGVIVNAGGIVAYYPTDMPLQHRAVALGDRDLYGDVVRAARAEGLVVLARMDSNRVAEDFYRAHADWICVDAQGRPYREADKYVTCINSPYYAEYLPKVMEEIIRRSHPDGFTDNSWAGIRRAHICHCRHCQEQFYGFSGLDLPAAHDWSNEGYRLWIRWNFKRRTELWDFNNAVTTKAGGENCRWMGMISGDMLNNSQRFIDLTEILPRAAIVMLDHQRRNGTDNFEQNTEAGKRLHGLAGWDKLIPESMPQYQLGSPAFRLASMPTAEVRLWSSSGFAGGIQPWWHHIGSMHEDRRQYITAEPIFAWHEANEDILLDRRPEADVAVLWSQANNDYYGQNEAGQRALDPYRGAVRALDKAGITYLPIHADAFASVSENFKVAVLPNLAAMSDAQVAAVEAFAAKGGSVIASGETSLFGGHGEPRGDMALSRLFGVHRQPGQQGAIGLADFNIEVSSRHTYLRLSPEIRAGVYGPHDRTAPEAGAQRHSVLAGLENTDTLPFGGFLPMVAVDEGVQVLATFIPDFPIYPPETSFMRQTHTEFPAIAVREAESGARLVWFAADLDRCYARDEQFEHALLIANAVRWALGDRARIRLEGGHGFVTANLYAQPGRQILHLNNRLITSRVPGRQNELVPVGPVTVRLRTESGAKAPDEVELRVAGTRAMARREGGDLVFEVDRVLDHEVAVIAW